MYAYDHQLEAEILSADPVKLVALLYQGALDGIRDARRKLAAGDIEGRGRAVSKVSAILLHLVSTLDHERGGEISRNLAELYDYLLRRLSEGNFMQMEQPFAEVEGHLVGLHGAWTSAMPDRVEPMRDLYAAEYDSERVCCVA